jgi:hypothetical protein
MIGPGQEIQRMQKQNQNNEIKGKELQNQNRK